MIDISHALRTGDLVYALSLVAQWEHEKSIKEGRCPNFLKAFKRAQEICRQDYNREALGVPTGYLHQLSM